MKFNIFSNKLVLCYQTLSITSKLYLMGCKIIAECQGL